MHRGSAAPPLWTSGPAFLALSGLVVLLGGALVEFHQIAAGTGRWYADISVKWFAGLVAFVVASLVLVAVCLVLPWREATIARLIGLRARLRGTRMLILPVLLLLPVAVLQYTPWGVVLRGPFLRVLISAICLVGAAWIVCEDQAAVWSAKSLMKSAALSASAIVVAAAFTNVTSYPFSLGWSEGNRLWDYSLLFGKSLYIFDAANPPAAYLDIGRQIIGGLPFLLPGVSIEGARAWLAIVAFLPYLVVGMLAFRPRTRPRSNLWMLMGLFGMLFLSQGPIHAPLVVCAILVLLAWRGPLGWGSALLAAAGFFAESSRFTWMFAPAIWIVMLEIGGAELRGGRVPPAAWRRAIVLGSCGLLGSALAFTGVLPLTDSSVGSSAAVSSTQDLLWYRLLPNPTYGDGVLFGLIKAVGPLVAILVFAWRRYRGLGRIQSLVICASLAAFLVVGLIVSTKIGGGGDLHNLDMLLIAVLLTAAIAWHAGGRETLEEPRSLPPLMQAALVISLVLPAYGALLSLQPIDFAGDAEWIAVLTDVERPRDLGSLPDATTTEASLTQVRAAVADAAALGPVLFMDQRQLLTFGFVERVELVPEYEKKRLMDEALSGNASYFAPFYRDLAEQRFALIVSSPLRTPIRGSEYGFGEENDAWVQWVARPVLCYYRELDTLNEVKVELLVPSEASTDCEAQPTARMP